VTVLSTATRSTAFIRVLSLRLALCLQYTENGFVPPSNLEEQP
jgi:hypothetical protein